MPATPPPLSELARGDSAFGRNAADTAYRDLGAQWMSLGASSLAPTPLQGDSFVIKPATLSPGGAQYLRIVDPLNLASHAFNRRLALWKPRGSRYEISDESTVFARAVRNAIYAISTAPWPTPAHVGIARLAVSMRAEMSELHTITHVSPNMRAARVHAFTHQRALVAHAGSIARRALGVPELTPDK